MVATIQNIYGSGLCVRSRVDSAQYGSSRVQPRLLATVGFGGTFDSNGPGLTAPSKATLQFLCLTGESVEMQELELPDGSVSGEPLARDTRLEI